MKVIVFIQNSNRTLLISVYLFISKLTSHCILLCSFQKRITLVSILFHTDKFVLIFLLNIFIRPDNETKVTRYCICNSRKIYFVWLLNVCAKRKVEKTEQLVRSPWLFMCFHVGKGVLVLSALMILFLTISSFFFLFLYNLVV